MRGEFSGTLRERIIIEALSDERSVTGLQSEQWREVCRCMAAIVVEGAGAETEAMALSAMPRFRVTIRPRQGVNVGQRLRWRTTVLMVRQLLSDPGQADRLVLRCEEGRS